MNSNDPFKKFHKRKPSDKKKNSGNRIFVVRRTNKNHKKIQKKLLKIPSRLEQLIEKYIENKTGKPIKSSGTLERIKQSILVQKAGYWKKNPFAKYERGYDVFAYLAYQAPVYIIQFHSIIQKLEKDGHLPDNIRILDLGSGPGVVPLALIWFLKERKRGTLSIEAIEQSEEFIEAFKFLASEFANKSPVKIEQIHQTDIRTWESQKPGTYTMITCQNVLAELPGQSNVEKASLLMHYCSFLADGGIMILVEPAELRHSTQLRIVQKELEKSGLFLYSPCRYIHAGRCEPVNCWSFEELPGIKPTRLMLLLSKDKEGYRFINTDIKFSYSILTKKPLNPVIPQTILMGSTPFRELEDNIGKTVDVIGVKMSSDIGVRDFSVFLLCDGSGGAKVYLVIPKSLKNVEIKKVKNMDYANIIKITSVRVRWNKNKNSINLIAGSTTQVSAIHK